MRVPRIFQPAKLAVGINLSLTIEAANHIVRVLRMPVGTELKIFNGEDGEYLATLILITKQQTVVEIKQYFATDVESPVKIHLGQAISRGEKMDYTIQKAVELGVAKITPLLTERCGVKLSEERWQKRRQHWQAIAIAACEQSGRNKIPGIAEPVDLNTWFKNTNSEYKLILHPESAGHAVLYPPYVNSKVNSVSLLVGPEGGFSENEVNFAVQHGFQTLQLGPRILRTETAALAAIAVLQSKFGDF